MLLAIDVGNTNTVLGLYDGTRHICHFRMNTSRDRTADETGMLMLQFFQNKNILAAEITDVVICSVVPTVMYSLEHAIRKYLNVEPVVVGPGTKTGMNIKYDNPKEVGADRIVNAVAAYHLYGGPVIIIDFGTATTFCAVAENGDYLGGLICPGIKISMEALFTQTAKLPRVEILKPPSVIGKTTITSMQSGAFYGFIGQVDYIVKKIRSELGQQAKAIATGGLARLISSESETIEEVNSFLTLEGLRLIHERNQ